MSANITNFRELTAEIARLKAEKREQEAFLQQQYALFCYKVETPLRIAKMVTSRIPGVAALKGLASGIGIGNTSKSNSDWLTKGLQLGLPLVLNRTLLKNAGWLKKGLVLIASETAAGQVNQNRITALVDRIANFIKPKKKKKKEKIAQPQQGSPNTVGRAPMITAEESVQDNIYGIPKDSESF